MTNLELATQIVSLLGGKANVVKATNGMTRLRVTCRNTELVDKDQIKALEGVLGLVNEGDYYQIILGPGKAKKVTDICVEELGLPRDAVSTDWQENKAEIKGQQKQSKLKDGMKLINFGSGAQYNKARDLVKVKEDTIGTVIPKDDYGYSKYVMSEDRKSTRLNASHSGESRMPSSA